MTATTIARLLSPEQLAERLTVSRSQAFKLLASGEIASVKIGKLRRIPEDAVREYIDRLTAEQNLAGASTDD